MQNNICTALTIAGSDCSGGAGIQADLKTFASLGVYGMSVITALTAQNTLGVSGIQAVDAEFTKRQLDCVFEDIPPMSVKTGMLPSLDVCRTVGDRLRYYSCKSIVCDPVMVSTSGHSLTDEQGVSGLEKYVFPFSLLITPNIPEAQVLTNMRIQTVEDMEKACRLLYEKHGCAVLCKGGHLKDSAADVLYANGKAVLLQSERINNPNTHGTGCTLSSAIAAYLSLGSSLEESVIKAKEYVHGAIAQLLNIGHGNGPLDHAYAIRRHIGNK